MKKGEMLVENLDLNSSGRATITAFLSCNTGRHFFTHNPKRNLMGKNIGFLS